MIQSLSQKVLQHWHLDYKAAQIPCARLPLPLRKSSTHSGVLLPAHIRHQHSRRQKISLNNTTKITSSRKIVLHLSQQHIQYKSNIQNNQQCLFQVFGFWHWKQLFFVLLRFHLILSFYPRLISPANRVISRIIVNPVSSPAFWIRKNTNLPR